jgi:hypothetical protein
MGVKLIGIGDIPEFMITVQTLNRCLHPSIYHIGLFIAFPHTKNLMINSGSDMHCE